MLVTVDARRVGLQLAPRTIGADDSLDTGLRAIYSVATLLLAPPSAASRPSPPAAGRCGPSGFRWVPVGSGGFRWGSGGVPVGLAFTAVSGCALAGWLADQLGTTGGSTLNGQYLPPGLGGVRPARRLPRVHAAAGGLFVVVESNSRIPVDGSIAWWAPIIVPCLMAAVVLLPPLADHFSVAALWPVVLVVVVVAVAAAVAAAGGREPAG